MKDYKLKSGNILRVVQDESSGSPDEWGDEGIFLVYDHRQFNVKRKGFEPKDIFDALNEGLENEEGYYTNYFIFPVAAYIHSGVSLSLTDSFERTGFDTSVTGFILVKKELAQELELDITIKDKYKELEDKAKEYAEWLIETWNQYLSGDVYGFRVLKPIKTYTITEKDLLTTFKNRMNRTTNVGLSEIIEKSYSNIEYEEIDSCWGFYGSDIRTNGILDHINDEIIEEL